MIGVGEIAEVAQAARDLLSAECGVDADRVVVTIAPELAGGTDLSIDVRIDGRPSPSAEVLVRELLGACVESSRTG